VVAVPLAAGRRNAEVGHTLHRIAEALAAGRALVAPDLPAVREEVDEDTALLYPPGDAVALAQALSELVADPDRRLDMGMKARTLAEDRYDEEVVAEPLIALYRELLEPSVMLAPELLGAPAPAHEPHAFEDLTDPDAASHADRKRFTGPLADETTAPNAKAAKADEPDTDPATHAG
jgi:hypothetical protein